MQGTNASEPLTWLFALLGLALMLATLPGTLELLWLTIGAILPLRRRRRPDPDAAPRYIAVIIPAHNEAANIAGTVKSLQAAEQPEGVKIELVVVADNCSDDTAARAREAGARVLERQHDTERGKGFALDFAFNKLLADGAEAVLVIDADTQVDPNFLMEAWMGFARGADAVQAPQVVLNVEASMRTRLMNVALFAMNLLRPRGREHWGLSVGILGNGWGVTRETLQAIPYTAMSIVEDLEYHLHIVRSGRRVRLLGRTRVRSETPSGGSGVATQRARWEGGRMRMMRDFIPKLFSDVLAGRTQLIEPLLDLLLLSLAYHVLLLLAALLIPYPITQAYALFGFCVVVFHVVSAVFLGGGGLRELAILGLAPAYILWKLTLAKAIGKTAAADAGWQRTQREAEREDQ